MRLFNETPFAVGHGHSILEPKKPFLTIAVKGTFALVPGGPCEPLPADKQPKVEKPTMYQDEHGNSLRTEADLVAFKPRADCLFVGTAHAPDGKATIAFPVTFGVGEMRKRLSVHGHRAWLRDADGDALLTEPEPIATLPLRAEYAHGGPRSQYNRHGIGFAPLGDAPGSSVPVANIRDPDVPLPHWDDDAPAAGFGVLPRNLKPRRTLAGTYDADWQYRRRPLPPKDYDAAFMNAARADQQVSGYLVGDEEMYFENLHSEHAVFTAKLPGVRVRCFVDRGMDPENPQRTEFAEVLTCLDTCFVDMEAGTVSLTWRGTMEVISPQHPRVYHLLISQEPVGSPLPLGDYAALMREKIEASMPNPVGGTPEEQRAKIDALNAKGKKRVVDLLKKNGVDTALIARIEAEDDLTGVNRILLEWVEELKKAMPPEAQRALATIEETTGKS